MQRHPSLPGRKRPVIHTPTPPAILVSIAAIALVGCSDGLSRIDHRVDDLVLEATRDINAEVRPDPAASLYPAGSASDPTEAERLTERPATENPSAEGLSFIPRPEDEAEAVIRRLDSYASDPANARSIDLPGALSYAVANSREYRFAAEGYVLTAMRLMIERHLWGPRFFDTVTADILSTGNDGLYDTSWRLVNELGVTQRLPYGGEVSARLLARATEDLHFRVAGENVQSADLLLSARIPLLRGSGNVAREDLIQAERDLVYAARAFERFRREFLFAIAADYLDLNVAFRRIAIAERSVLSFENLAASQQALLEAGRVTPFEAAEAANDRLDAIDVLNDSRESYRVALDRFKARIGMNVDDPLVVDLDSLDLPTPVTDIDSALRAALRYRLDLQNRRDQLVDSYRAVDVARDRTRGDLELRADVGFPTDSDLDRPWLNFEPGDANYRVGVLYDVPLDREIEKLSLRQTQIALARAERSYDEFRDDIAINVRRAVREIDAATFSLAIQERNFATAQLREAAIRADPGRATVRQQSDAITQTARAENSVELAKRDLEVAVLGLLLATGQLRVEEAGTIRGLPGMETGIPDSSPTAGNAGESEPVDSSEPTLGSAQDPAPGRTTAP